MYPTTRLILATMISLCFSSVTFADSNECEAGAAQYVFSWPISDGCDDLPRGGTSKGADVEIDKRPHSGWLAIQDRKISKFEKDRAAILAMAGGYKVDFDFLETVGYSEGFERDKPYHSWGTEYVYVIEDQPKFISLQHLMVMYFKQDDGSVSEPFVMKHWRQDWTYQDKTLLEYDHSNQWRKKKLSIEDVEGTWSQAVFQVDDSPRYESFGRWLHNASFSTWLSGRTRRPLPRRESSVRNDYQVLEGYNRHSITRVGWVQEEENWKLVVADVGNISSEDTYISKEEGVARYQLTTNTDFSPGDHYMNNTQSFWATVREVWRDEIDIRDSISLKENVDGKPLFMALFSLAEEQTGKDMVKERKDQVRKIITDYLQ